MMASKPTDVVKEELRAACEAMLELFEPKPELPDDIAEWFRHMVSKSPILIQVRAAIASHDKERMTR